MAGKLANFDENVRNVCRCLAKFGRAFLPIFAKPFEPLVSAKIMKLFPFPKINYIFAKIFSPTTIRVDGPLPDSFDPVFGTSPKRSFSIIDERFRAWFRENWVYKFGHCSRIHRSLTGGSIPASSCRTGPPISLRWFTSKFFTDKPTALRLRFLLTNLKKKFWQNSCIPPFCAL